MFKLLLELVKTKAELRVSGIAKITTTFRYFYAQYAQTVLVAHDMHYLDGAWMF